jgi:hypothetical protein
MKNVLASLIVLSGLAGSAFALPFTFLTGVYRYTKLTDGNVTVEGGGLYSSGEYSASFTQTKTAAELAGSGLDAGTLDTITGKFITGADYIDSELATAEGRDRLANYSFSKTGYTTDLGRVYIITAGGFTPKVPKINVSVTKSSAKEGGKPVNIELKLSEAATDELIVRFALAGSAKFKTDYTGPSAEYFVEIPKGKTTFRIPVRPVDDKLKESTETLTFQLVKNDGYKIGKDKSVTVRIKDND